MKIYFEDYVNQFCNNKAENEKSKGMFTVLIGSKGCVENCIYFKGQGEDAKGRYINCSQW